MFKIHRNDIQKLIDSAIRDKIRSGELQATYRDGILKVKGQDDWISVCNAQWTEEENAEDDIKHLRLEQCVDVVERLRKLFEQYPDIDELQEIADDVSGIASNTEDTWITSFVETPARKKAKESED